MNINDFSILMKKILVGILIYLIPAVIIISGLLLIASFLKAETPPVDYLVPMNEFLH